MNAVVVKMSLMSLVILLLSIAQQCTAVISAPTFAGQLRNVGLSVIYVVYYVNAQLPCVRHIYAHRSSL